MRKINLILALAFIAFLPVLGQKAENLKREKEKITQAINSSIGWFKTKDTSLLFSIIPDDTCYLCVNPHNKVEKGSKDFRKNVPMWMNPDITYVSHEIRDLRISIAGCGKVAWFFCRLDDISSYKGAISGWKDVRWTGVMEKRNRKWVIVQQHFSYPSDQ